MFYINKKNLYIRVIIAIFIIAGIGLAFMGGIDFVNAHIVDSSGLPKEYTATDPFTDRSVKRHMSATAMNKEYKIQYSEIIQTGDKTLKNREVTIKVSNSERIGYKVIDSMSSDKEIYETKKKVYIKKNNSTEIHKKSSDYRSPILRNQFRIATTGLNNFTVFKWSLVSIDKGIATYTLSRVDPNRSSNLYTIDSAKGTLKLNVNKGYITEVSVYLTGMSKENPTKLTTVGYTYDVSTTMKLDQPKWVSGLRRN